MLFSKPGLPTKLLLSLAITFSSTSAAFANSAAACQAGQAGCVLPVDDVRAAPAPAPAAYVDEEGGGFGLLPILALLAAAAAVLYFTVLDDDDDEAPVSP